MYRSRRFFGNRSGEVARKRLKLLLAADKTNCSPEFLEMIKEDIFLAVSRYLEIEQGDIEIGLTKSRPADGTEGVPALYAAIPIDGRLIRGHVNAVI